MTPASRAVLAALALVGLACGYYGPPRWPEERRDAPRESAPVISDTAGDAPEDEPRTAPEERDE